YLFGRARLKSYSSSMSSPLRRLLRTLLVFIAFFIVPAFTSRCLAGAHNAYRIFALREHYHEQPPSQRFTHENKPLFTNRVPFVPDDTAKRIAKYGHCFLE